MKPKLVSPCDVKLDPVSGLIRIDQIPIFKVVRRGDILLLQVMDGNKPRAEYRKTNLVEIPLDEFIGCITQAGEQFEG